MGNEQWAMGNGKWAMGNKQKNHVPDLIILIIIQAEWKCHL